MAASPSDSALTAAPLVPTGYRVVSKERETHDTWTLELEPVAGALERFAPGQFSMLGAFGAGEVPISISGDVSRPGSLVHTVRAVGNATRAICALEPGGWLGARGPFGTHWPIERAEGGDVLVMAGGIGLAPLRPVIYHVLAHREHYGRLIVLYGGRSPGDLLYVRELEGWRGRFDVDLEVTVDAAGSGWRGHVGVVTTLIPRAQLDPGRTTALICGPEVMMRLSASALRDVGMSSPSIHFSMERNMKCGVGHCGHCQLRELFICKDGPVFSSDRVEPLMHVRSL